MKRALGIYLLLAFSVGASAVTFAGESHWGLRTAAKEVREEIADVREAIAEVTPRQNNVEEICFRVGSLYLTTLRELEEAAAAQTNASARAKQLLSELTKDGHSLPSFCGDTDKVKREPGYEQGKNGDLGDLKRELANMERRAPSFQGCSLCRPNNTPRRS